MMNNIKRNVDFFKINSTIQLILLYEKKLLHANKDQINVISQFTLNMLKKKIPLPPTDCGQTWAAGMRVGPFKRRPSHF